MKFQSLIDRREESAKRACANAKETCLAFENRNAGSEAERETSAFLQNQLREVCDDVKNEEFDVYPEAYSGVFYIVPTCALLATVAYFFTAMVSLLLAVIGIFVLAVQFSMNLKVFDLLYPKKKSQNVTAVNSPVDEIKNRVFFVANVDATKEWTLKYRLGSTMFITMFFSLFFGLSYVSIADIAHWITVGGLGSQIVSGDMLVVGFVSLVFVPFYIAAYFAVDKKRVVPGANENLSGCAVAIEIMRGLKENDVRLENTEVGVILTGSGAVGSRGASEWCCRHKNELKDAKTYFVCLNTLKEVNSLGVNRIEANGLVYNDKTLAKLLADCAKDAQLPFAVRGLPFGQTDSAEFSRSGFSSVSVTGYNPKSPEYLHTRYDTADNLSEDCISNAYTICVKLLEKIDENA